MPTEMGPRTMPSIGPYFTPRMTLFYSPGKARPRRGNGYLAGQFPDGTTTIDGAPTSATVRVLYRPAAGAPGDGAVVAQVQSAQDGTWLVEGLDPDLTYDVVGRKAGFNDVIMSKVQPIPTTEIAALGELVWDVDQFYGSLTLVGGGPPYTVTAFDGFPEGLSPAISGRRLSVQGQVGFITGEFTGVIGLADATGLTGSVTVEFEVVPRGDPLWGYVAALLHFDDPADPWKDETGELWIPNTSSTLAQAVGKFGGSCEFVPTGSGKTIRSSSHAVGAFGTGDFTVEAFIYSSEAPSGLFYSPFGNWVSQSGGCMFLKPQMALQWSGGHGVIATGLNVVPLATFVHVEYSRSAGVGRIFVNGKLEAEGPDTYDYPNVRGWTIGSNATPTDWWRGHVDEFRITKGVARHTEDFTPPTEPFPNFGPPVDEPELPTVIGEPFGGGFYAGDIESDGQWYKLIVADKAADITGANSRLKTSNTNTPGTDHLTDGVSNTAAMFAAGIELHPAAAHCINHQGGGFDDWYMPAKDELDVIYQNLGFNRPNCPPDFQAGGPQAFFDAWYRASTQFSSNNGWLQHFSDGREDYGFNKYNTNPRVRPVRRLQFNP